MSNILVVQKTETQVLTGVFTSQQVQDALNGASGALFSIDNSLLVTIVSEASRIDANALPIGSTVLYEGTPPVITPTQFSVA